MGLLFMALAHGIVNRGHDGYEAWQNSLLYVIFAFLTLTVHKTQYVMISVRETNQ